MSYRQMDKFNLLSKWKSLLFLLGLFQSLHAQSILQYRPVLLIVQHKESNRPEELAIRSFWRDTHQMYLIVQPDSLYTHEDLATDYTSKPTDWNYLRMHWSSKPYIKALSESLQNDSRLQNAGLIHLRDPEPGISLTIDLCPSKLSLDKRVFNALCQSITPYCLTVPVALSISGQWLLSHKDDLSWLKSLAVQKELNIIWINHTMHHHWNPNLPLYENFLLEQGTDLITEVLGNEELLLEHGLLPSCFFRFPGLVSDKSIIEQIANWGLISIGSDAWLSKGQKPKDSGSIVLVHANGHDLIGINAFLRLLQNEKEKLKSGQWRLIDLREEIQKE
ncbi:MAG: polysaccharide deacetylase [Saprospiraceae bacterium]